MKEPKQNFKVVEREPVKPRDPVADREWEERFFWPCVTPGRLPTDGVGEVEELGDDSLRDSRTDGQGDEGPAQGLPEVHDGRADEGVGEEHHAERKHLNRDDQIAALVAAAKAKHSG